MTQWIMTVTGKDRAGIIAGVTGVLFRRKVNLEDISMTVLEGEFAMILIAGVRHSGKIESLVRDIRAFERKAGLTVSWKILKRRLKRGEKHGTGTDTYLVCLAGRDRTGLVYATSRLLARERLNITDLNSKILGCGKKAVYTMMLEVDVPRRYPKAKLVRSLGALSRRLGVEIQIKPLERLTF